MKMTNETRLIDANAPMIKEYFNPKLIKYSDFVKECNWLLEHPPLIHHATNWRRGVQMAVEVAIRLRPVDAKPVVRGRWEQCFEDWRHQIEGDKCSACGFEHYGCGIKHYHYCPNCGADMRKE